MASRALHCPACGKSLGTVIRWAYKGTVHARFFTNAPNVVIEKYWRGRFVHCPCGEKVKLGEDVEATIR